MERTFRLITCLDFLEVPTQVTQSAQRFAAVHMPVLIHSCAYAPGMHAAAVSRHTATNAACHVASQRPFSGVSTSPAVPHTYFRSFCYRCFFASLLTPFRLSFTVFCSRRLLKFLRRQMTSSSKQSTQSSQVLRHLPDSPSMLAASLSHLPSSASFLWQSSRVRERGAQIVSSV